MQRRPLQSVTSARVAPEDTGFLIEDLMDLVSEEQMNEDEILQGIMETFGTNELEQIALSIEMPPPPPPPRVAHRHIARKKTTSSATHSGAYQKVRQMR
tara:strand:- start:18742 stop:19038 length:297 start_codon:yes stop_codon:yes gene_type:complete